MMVEKLIYIVLPKGRLRKNVPPLDTAYGDLMFFDKKEALGKAKELKKETKTKWVAFDAIVKILGETDGEE